MQVVLGDASLLRPDVFGPVEGDDFLGELFLDALDQFIRLSAAAVYLVDEDDRGDTQLPQSPEQNFCLRLNPFYGRDQQDSAIKNAEGALDLCQKVRVSWRIDQVDFQVVDEKRDDRGFDRDASSLFEIHRIGLGRPFIYPANFVDDVRFIQDSLGQACLSRVYVRDNPYIDSCQFLWSF